MKLIIASHNKDKCLELIESLSNQGFKVYTLNDFPEFEGLNPSLENFCRIIGDMFCNKLSVSDVYSVEVKLWEDSSAWASHTRILK